VIGKADAEPLFPDDPCPASDRRIALLLLDEPPPVAVGLKPKRSRSAVVADGRSVHYG
jgi:chemotaxis protein MotB